MLWLLLLLSALLDVVVISKTRQTNANEDIASATILNMLRRLKFNRAIFFLVIATVAGLRLSCVQHKLSKINPNEFQYDFESLF